MSVRQITVCDYCRRGKRKCDKLTPCGSCLKYKKNCTYSINSNSNSNGYPDLNNGSYNNSGIGHTKLPTKRKLDTYERDQSLSESPPVSQRLIENSEEDSRVHTINIYRDYCHECIMANSEQTKFGPLSWVSFVKSDGALQNIWRYIDMVGMQVAFKVDPYKGEHLVLNKNSVSIMDMTVGSPTPPTNMNGSNSSSASLTTSSIPSVPSSSSSISSAPIGSEAYNHLRQQYLTGIVLENETSLVDDSSILSESYLLSLLPTRKTLWILVRRYFKSVYPYIPIIDERDFRTRISSILDEESFENIPFLSIKLNDRYDFAYVGILLVMIRLGYLSYFSVDLYLNDPVNLSNYQDSKTLERKFVLENPISLQFIIMAQKCLDEFNIFQRTSVAVLQLAILLRTYRHIAPEEGDGPDGADSQVLTATLISMASNLGVSRTSSTNSKASTLNERQDSLFRKLGVHLCNLNATECLSFGTPSGLNQQFFDIQCPIFDSSASNLIDTDLEKKVISAYIHTGDMFGKLDELYHDIIDLNKSMRIEELTEKIDAMTKLLLEDLPNNSDFSEFENAFKTKSTILGLQFVISIYFIVFNHYESHGIYELSFKYMLKILKLIMNHVIPFIKLFNDKHDNATFMGIVPVLQTMYLKIILILCSILIRTNFSIQTEKSDQERMKRLMLLSAALKNTCVDILKVFAVIGVRYYYFWTIHSNGIGVLRICSSKEFYEPLKSSPIPDSRLNYSSSQIQQILPLFYNWSKPDFPILDIDSHSTIFAELPDISNPFISEGHLHSFWYYIKKNSKTNATMKRFPNSSISIPSPEFSSGLPYGLDIFNEFYSDLFNSE
ncbi:fungal transcriptional regulatory protein [Scheffersomyces amazonensis]|uniref:fungal transcriptional regulatory protein n=1 Tax=Scheffersomyces amazonensis TaxID=1078765 RepID=UPI00315DA97E